MSEAFFTAGQRLLSATANGVYQGVLVAALAGLTLRMSARTNAATRHAIWLGVLLFVTALIPAHLLLSCWTQPELAAITNNPAALGVDHTPSYIGNTEGLTVVDAAFAVPQPVETRSGSVDDLPNFFGTGPQIQPAIVKLVSNDHPEPVAAEGAWSRLKGSILNSSFWKRENAITLPHSICLGLISAWILLAGIRGGLILGRIDDVRRVKQTAGAPSQRLQALFEKLRASLASKRDVRLKISGMNRAAVVLGFVHPVVLLPAEMDQDGSEGEVELVLRHELAHVVRRDDWSNLLQQFVQAALFFHPAVWWICAKLSLEREIACDDFVLEGSGQPRAYALALADVASRMNYGRPLLAPGVSDNKSQLQQRIIMILNKNRDRSPRLARSRLGLFTTATAILAVLALTAGPRLVLAQPPAAPPEAPEPAAAPEPPEPPEAPDAPEAPEPPEPPEPPDADVAPVAVTADISIANSGPRPKPSIGVDDNSDDVAPVAIAPTVSVTPAMPPMRALVSIDQGPDSAPVPPASPEARKSKRHLSVEERLDRIERILDDIESRAGRGRHNGGENFSMPEAKIWRDPHGNMSLDLNLDMDLQRAAREAKRAAEEAARTAEAGQREAEMGKRSMEQAMRDMEKLKSEDIQRMKEKMREAEAEGPIRELEALRAARESLKGQVQKLESEIKRLEEERHQRKEPAHIHSDNEDDAPRAKTVAPEKTF